MAIKSALKKKIEEQIEGGLPITRPKKRKRVMLTYESPNIPSREIVNEACANLFKGYRIRRGFNKSVLSRRIGITRRAITKKEELGEGMDLFRIIQFAKVIGVRPETLIANILSEINRLNKLKRG